ncbi:hypothetical protein A5703_25185 [Mycobacterium sp. E188]|nr:hypothetical protein A5703_25185 [Mycobacterium sp. E188]OBH44410.1 hypothetical protein A5691_16260 [Mycobacterium sp. E183]
MANIELAAAIVGGTVAVSALVKAMTSWFLSRNAKTEIVIRRGDATVRLDPNKLQDAEEIIQIAADLSARGNLSAEAQVVPKRPHRGDGAGDPAASE